MLKRDVVAGNTYVAKVSGHLTNVRITGISVHGGWNGINTATGRDVRIRSAARLRSKVEPVNRLTAIRGYRAGGMSYEEARDLVVKQINGR